MDELFQFNFVQTDRFRVGQNLANDWKASELSSISGEVVGAINDWFNEVKHFESSWVSGEW